MSAPGASVENVRGRLTDALAEIREDDRARWIATALGAAIGLLAASVDPLGLVVGGALVAVPARDAYRGLGAAFGFGLLVIAIFLLGLFAAGSLGPASAMGLPFVLPIGIALVLSLLGGLVRGLG